MKRNVVKCTYCEREISKSNITKHEQACIKKTFSKGYYKLNHDDLICQFCGKECKNKNSLCNHERLCKNNPNRQIGVGFDKFNAERKAGNVESWNKGLTAESDTRVYKQANALRQYYKTHKGPWAGRTHTDEEKLKIGASVKAFLLDHPDMVPYLRNHSSAESYPEKYFKELFASENLTLTYHYRIGTYELDFCDLDKKLDIEIDGDQHYLDSRIIESDKKRTEYLENLGWTVFRIRWSEFKKYSEAEKIHLIATIKNLLI